VAAGHNVERGALDVDALPIAILDLRAKVTLPAVHNLLYPQPAQKTSVLWHWQTIVNVKIGRKVRRSKLRLSPKIPELHAEQLVQQRRGLQAAIPVGSMADS
jgi:hypothetical protein